MKTKLKSERGALLISLIVTMVVIAILGGGMLYFSSTSSYGELLANRQARAYYIAESGVNYALQQFLASGNPYSGKCTLTGGDYFDVTTSIVQRGSPASDWLVVKSTGNVGSGWLQTRQLVTKEIEKSKIVPPGIPPTATDSNNVPLGFDSNTDATLDTTWTVVSGTTDIGTGGVLEFQGTTNLIDINTSVVNLCNAWLSNGNLSSYFLQVKIDNSKMSPGDYYLIGLSFRIIDTNNSYGLSFYRSNGANGPNTWWDTAAFADFRNKLPTVKDNKTYAVLWKKIGGTFTVLAYARMDYATYGVINNDKFATLIPWSTLLIRVNERFDATSGARRNYLKAYVQSPSHTIYPDYPLYPKDTISWSISSFKQITWTWTSPATAVINGAVVDSTFTSVSPDFCTCTSSSCVPNRPEIGIHAYYDSSGIEAQLFDDFAVAVQGTEGGATQY